MAEDSGDGPEKEASSGGAYLTGAILLGVGYILSPPLALKVFDAMGLTSGVVVDVFEVIYYPLYILYMKVPFYRGYVDWGNSLLDSIWP